MTVKSTGDQIARAKELVGTVRHAAMATVNEDGSPHNSPVQIQIDEQRQRIYWASNPVTLHSQNLARTGQLFVVLYEPNKGGGLFLRCEGAHILSGEELQEGLRLRNQQRAELGIPPVDIEHYTGSTPQRMYGAKIEQLWTNTSEKDKAGNVTNDYRLEISRVDLRI